MDFEIENELRPFLSPGEKLLWTGRPKTGIAFRSTDIYLIPFSIFYCGFAIFWLTGAVSMGAPLFFSLFGIPFVALGLYLVFGRFILDAIKRKHTAYGITDNRIIIRSGIFSQETKSLNISTISDLNLRQKSNGTGTITLGPTDFRYTMFSGMYGWPGVKQIPALEFINDVQQVYDLIVQLQRKKHVS